MSLSGLPSGSLVRHSCRESEQDHCGSSRAKGEDEGEAGTRYRVERPVVRASGHAGLHMYSPAVPRLLLASARGRSSRSGRRPLPCRLPLRSARTSGRVNVAKHHPPCRPHGDDLPLAPLRGTELRRRVRAAVEPLLCLRHAPPRQQPVGRSQPGERASQLCSFSPCRSDRVRPFHPHSGRAVHLRPRPLPRWDSHRGVRFGPHLRILGLHLHLARLPACRHRRCIPSLALGHPSLCRQAVADAGGPHRAPHRMAVAVRASQHSLPDACLLGDLCGLRDGATARHCTAGLRAPVRGDAAGGIGPGRHPRCGSAAAPQGVLRQQHHCQHR